jgi:hypothetical protein
MFSKNFPHVVHQKMLSLEIQLIQRCIRLVRILYTASTGAATADTALYTANSALKWGFFLVGDEKRSNFAFTKQGQSVVPRKSKNILS